SSSSPRTAARPSCSASPRSSRRRCRGRIAAHPCMPEPPMTDDAASVERPLDRLRVLAKQDVLVTPALRHIEGFTLEGLLTFLWHGDPGAERVVLMCGGAMGGLLGPAKGLYHDLGETLAAQGVGSIRIGYRRPNDLPAR